MCRGHAVSTGSSDSEKLRAEWRSAYGDNWSDVVQYGAAAGANQDAAYQHREAAKHYKAGNHEKAAYHAHMAHGHHLHAADHAAEAAKQMLGMTRPPP